MHFKYGFGKKNVEFEIDDKNIIMELKQNNFQVKIKGIAEIKNSLKNPIGSDKLKNIVKPGEKVVIITSDITRPMPSRVVLPLLLEELFSAGIKNNDITIVFALGSHRPHTDEEKEYLVGEEVYKSIRCIDSNPDDYIHLGTTSRGTPVDIFKEVANADRRICLGNIEYHYFAGYSGGLKAVMPGVSTRAAIQSNHSSMVNPEAKAGSIDNNPVRNDIEEIADFISIDFILNVVLDENKNIIKAFAGQYISAHREGCKFLDKIYKIKIPQKADIVITTPGGYPKDINLYQAQKALDNAKHAVRDGGIIILLASCSEGLGESVFENWITNASSPDYLIKRIQKNFELGGHKAAAIAMVLQKAEIFLVSDLDSSFVESIFMQPFKSIDSALQKAFEKLGENSGIILMPSGGSTLPVI